MGRFFRSVFGARDCRMMVFFLALCWVMGLLFGALCGSVAAGMFPSGMDLTKFSLLDPFSAFLVVAFPFVSSAVVVCLSHRMLLIVAFAKAFCFSYVSAVLMLSFGSAGWLVCILLLLGDGMTLPLLWWYWYRILTERSAVSICVAGTLAVAIWWLDYAVFSPFVANVIFC